MNRSQAPADITESETSNKAISVLSLDGGGIRGLSSLLILQRVMEGVTCKSEPFYPWKYFEIIYGTSTGGLIAIMLGRLRMSTQEAIDAYQRLGEEIFSSTKWFWKDGWYKRTNLEWAVKQIIGEAEDGGEVNRGNMEVKKGFFAKAFGQKVSAQDKENEKKGEEMGMKDTREDMCRTFVCAVDSANTLNAVHFRTYMCPENASIADCNVAGSKVWEAARATSAAPSFFKSISIHDSKGAEKTFLDGALRCNNPTLRLIEEMDKLELSTQPACILSIGAGGPRTISIPKVGCIPKLQLFEVMKALRDMATSCETVNQDVVGQMKMRKDVYVRLNVELGMEMGLDEWKMYGEVRARTMAYLGDPDVQKKLNILSRRIQIRQECRDDVS